MSAPMPAGLTPDHAVVGATDVDATTAFLEAFGQEILAETPGGVVLGVPGAAAVIRVEPGRPGPTIGPYATGGEALDLYTRDLDASLAIAEGLAAAGLATHGSAVSYDFGPLRLGQLMLRGPDGLPLVLVAVDHRLPSVLDDPGSADRLHSELHSVVWSVPDLAAATAAAVDAGLELRATFPLAEPEVGRFMGLPHPTTLRMSVLAGAGARPPRFELLAYDPDDLGRVRAGAGGHRGARPLVGGAIRPVFTTPDLDALAERLGEPVEHDAYGPLLVAAMAGAIDIEVRPGADGNVGPFYAAAP